MNMPKLSLRQRVEVAFRCVLGIVFAVGAGIYFQGGLAAFGNIDAAMPLPAQIGRALLPFIVGLYTALIAILYALRLQPVSKFPGFGPTVAALLGGFLMAAFLLLTPREDLPLSTQLAACGLVFFGNGLAVYVLAHLGRSFSILPESRKLVTHGPYALVRHPLYLAEAVASMGVVIIFLSPAAFAIFAVQLAWQFARMHYEEKVLSKTFPAYKAYAKRTKRLIPGIY